MEQEPQPSHVEQMRAYLAPEQEDEDGFLTPSKPSQLRALTDDELFRMLRKVAFANHWPLNAKVEYEATARLIAALKDFRRSSDRAAALLVVLTIALVVLTAVIVWLTAELE